ncbi:TolB family protein, partial [Asanoa ferruginea]
MNARRILLTASAIALLLTTAACETGHAVAAGLPSASAAPRLAAKTSPTPAPKSMTGQLYYADSDRLVRFDGSGVKVVLPAGAYSANVSPDGARIAFVDERGNVVVTDRNGREARTVARGAITAGYEPAWSPDSTKLLVGKGGEGVAAMGIVTVASATFTPLRHQPPDAFHYLWSADGRHLAYATGTCGIGVADADGGNARLVPGFGDQRHSCDPYSVSPDGR